MEKYCKLLVTKVLTIFIEFLFFFYQLNFALTANWPFPLPPNKHNLKRRGPSNLGLWWTRGCSTCQRRSPSWRWRRHGFPSPCGNATRSSASSWPGRECSREKTRRRSWLGRSAECWPSQSPSFDRVAPTRPFSKTNSRSLDTQCLAILYREWHSVLK